MKKYLRNIFCVIIVLFVFMPMKAKAANISFSSVEIYEDMVCITVNTDTVGDYKIEVDYSKYDEEGSYLYDTLSASAVVGDQHEVGLKISTGSFKEGPYYFEAKLMDNIQPGKPYHGSNPVYTTCEIYKQFKKRGGALTVSDYEIPDPTVPRPVKYNNVSKKDKKSITKLTNTFFKNVKRYDINGMKSCFNKIPVNSFVGNKYVQQFIRKAHKKHLKYRIREISVNKNKAKMKLYVRFYDASNATYYVIRNSTRKTSQEKVAKWMTQIYNAEHEFGEDVEITYSITIKLEKVNGNWKIKSMPFLLRNITDCKIIETINMYSK